MTTYRFMADGLFVQCDGRLIAWDKAGMPSDPRERQDWKDAGSPQPKPYLDPHPTWAPPPTIPAMPRNLEQMAIPQPGEDARPRVDVIGALDRIEEALAAATDAAALRAQVRALVEVMRALVEVPR